MIKFSVLVPTYNRHKLVIHTLRSLLAQTYTDFEILLFDNGSNPPVYDAVVREFNDNRIKFRRYEENTDINDLGEEALNQMSGTHFLWLADDDALTPSALEIVAKVLESNNNIDLLFVGFANFKHGTDLQPGVWSCPNELDSFSGLLEEFNAEEAGLYFCNLWGIGAKHNYNGPRMAWPSSIFLSRRLIDVTRKRQGELFIKPFGDVGYVGACFNTEKSYYLDLPLSVIGDTAVRDSVAAKPGMRRKWDKKVRWLEHTPIRGVSHINLAVDIHLKTLYRNGLNKKYDCRLRPDFYYRHLANVVSDSPWTKVTVRDLAECLPYLIISHYQFFSVRDTIRGLYQLPLRVAGKILSRLNNNRGTKPSIKGIEFENIYQFAVWVDDNHVKPNRGMFKSVQ